MGYIFNLVIVCLFVFTAGQSADLSIGVSYISTRGESVSYQLFQGDSNKVQFSTNNITLVCNSGTFNLTNAVYENLLPYVRINDSVYLIQSVFVNILTFMRGLECCNQSSCVQADLRYSGVGLVQSISNVRFVGLTPGSAVQITPGDNDFIACLTSGDINNNNNNNFPNLYWPNGTQFQLYPGLNSALSGVTYGIYSTAGLQLRMHFDPARDVGEYRCATLDGDSRPINLTFVLFTGDTDPCNLTSCPQYSQCNGSGTDNLCECEYEFLEYTNARCQCPEGYTINGTAPPSGCEDINECVAATVCSELGQNATCTNIPGSHMCTCQSNYTVANDGMCIHICEALNCAQYSNRICQWNVNQSFSCECINGYIPTPNSLACSLATTTSSTSIPTTTSSTSIPTTTSSTSIPTTTSSTSIPTTTSSTSIPTTTSSTSIPTTTSSTSIPTTTSSTSIPTTTSSTSIPTTTSSTSIPTTTSSTSIPTTSSSSLVPTTSSSSLVPTTSSSSLVPTTSSSSLVPTTSSSSLVPTTSSSSLVPTTSSSSLVPTVSSSSLVPTTSSSSLVPTVSSSSLVQEEIADRLENLTSLTEEDTNEILDLISSSLSNTSGAQASNFASAADLVNQVTQLMDNITTEQLEGLLDILSSVATLSVLTDIQNDVDSSVGDVVSDIVGAVENIAQLLAPLFYKQTDKTVIENDNIRLEVNSLQLDKGTVVFGENTTAEFSLRSLLSSSFSCKMGQNCTLNITDCQTVGVSIQIKNLNRFVSAPVPVFESWFCSNVEEEVLDSSSFSQSANTDLFSFSLASVLCDINTSNLSEPIRFNFTLLDTSLTDPTCVSLSPEDGNLYPDTSTCTQVPSSSEGTISCSCDHLTAFSILMSPDTKYQNSFGMTIFTYLGLGVSIVSLTIALLVFTFIRFKVSIAIFFVHYNLMLTVLLSEIVFLVGIDRSEIPALCLIVSVVLHYILLVSFCWMFFEIFNLLILIFKPRINQKRIIHLYWPLAYGIPVVVVGTTLAVSYCNYGNYRGVSFPTPMSTNCWLPRRDGNYWAFIGPTLFIIFVNSLMLTVLIVKLIHLKWAGKSYRASSLHKSTSHTLSEGFISAFRATVLLLPIMGFTWIFGVFAINSGDALSQVFQWLFLLFNCFQGFFIFLFYCVLKTEVRDAVLLLILRKVFRREIRLAEGESLFSSISFSRNLSVGTDKSTLKQTLSTSDSPYKSYGQDIGLVPVSPAKTHSLSSTNKSCQMAYSNPATDPTKEL